MIDLAANLEAVESRIAAAAAKAGRAPGDIQLIAVSKKQDAEKVRAIFDAGQPIFGESRVQEARAKIPLLPVAVRWHFIGHLQKNKIRHALPLFELFHSIDSLALAQDLERIAAEEGARPRVLLEVNVSGEGSKIGFSPENLKSEFDALLELSRFEIEGLMTIPPLAADSEKTRPYFATLRDLRDEMEEKFGLRLPQLSMGMSNDYPVAIEEGATAVRVGTAIFGDRGR
ncbi:MAG: YggS family pyridoxal phosphate-dependent enzyme [Chthoniobacterales bacterium]